MLLEAVAVDVGLHPFSIVFRLDVKLLVAHLRLDLVKFAGFGQHLKDKDIHLTYDFDKRRYLLPHIQRLYRFERTKDGNFDLVESDFRVF